MFASRSVLVRPRARTSRVDFVQFAIPRVNIKCTNTKGVCVRLTVGCRGTKLVTLETPLGALREEIMGDLLLTTTA